MSHLDKLLRRAEERKRSKSGLDDLPCEVAAAIEAHEAAPKNGKPADTAPELDSTGDLIERLTKIRERLFWLAAVYAVTLSRDVDSELDKYRRIFLELGAGLKTKDPDAFAGLTAGYESLLFAKPIASKPSIPLELQRRCELLSELQTRPKPEPKPAGFIGDGLGPFP